MEARSACRRWSAFYFDKLEKTNARCVEVYKGYCFAGIKMTKAQVYVILLRISNLTGIIVDVLGFSKLCSVVEQLLHGVCPWFESRT